MLFIQGNTTKDAPRAKCSGTSPSIGQCDITLQREGKDRTWMEE